MARDVTPERAAEKYLQERKPELSDSSLYNHRSLLRQFRRWCDEEGIESMQELDGFLLSDFKVFRRENDGVNEVTLRANMSVLRVFIKWCESRDLVAGGLSEKILPPDPDDDARDEAIDQETAERILNYLEKYEYATLRHALFSLLWDTGMRVGTVRALDKSDFHPDEKYIVVTHRPDKGTPLKNGEGGEREVNLHGWVCQVLSDYMEMHRHDVTDDHGREPLLTTEHGRPHRTTLRKHVVALTRPCYYTGECPHDREKAACEATNNSAACKCPSSVSPHPVRRGAISAWLNCGHSKELVSDRCDVSVDTLEKHYDARSESEKRELRREMFDMG